MAGRARHDIQFWVEHANKHRGSGLPLREYCRREGIKVHQFTYWRQRAAETAVHSESAELRPVTSNEAAGASRLDGAQTIVIQISDRTSIHVPGHMLESLEAVLKIVQRQSDQAASPDVGAFRSVAVRS